MTVKRPWGIRISNDARAIIKRQAEARGISQAAIVELAVREFDQDNKVKFVKPVQR